MSNEVANIEQRKSAISAGGKVSAIIPQSAEECFRLSEAIYQSNMAPYGLDSPQKIMIAMMSGLELGLPPMTAVQSIAVINNRPCMWGDALIGVVRSSPLCAYVHESIEGEGDNRIAYCETQRVGEAKPVIRSFSVDDAKRAGLWQTQARVTKTGRGGQPYEKDNDSPWYRYPQRMLQMRARAWCLRDVYADVLKGMQVREEVEDYRHETQFNPEPRPSIASRFEGKTLEAPEGFDHGHVQRQIADARGEDQPIPETTEPDGDVAPSSVPSGSRSAPGSTDQLPDPGSSSGRTSDFESEDGGSNPSPGATARTLTADVFHAYHEALRRFDAVEKLEKAADRFWPDNGGWPPASKDDKRLALKIFDAHKNRVESGVGHEDTNAFVGELIADVFGETGQ